MPAVDFNIAKFRDRYPEFDQVSDPILTAYFEEAGLYFNNTGASLEQDLDRRTLLLNMLVAHIAANASASLVGRVTSATEGTVSVTADAGALPGSMSWFMWSKYGAAFWQATRRYRTFRYITHPALLCR